MSITLRCRCLKWSPTTGCCIQKPKPRKDSIGARIKGSNKQVVPNNKGGRK